MGAARTARTPRPAGQSEPRPIESAASRHAASPAVARQYSLEVQGWASKDHDDKVFGLRSIRLVASSAADAIARARKLLDPRGEYADEKQWAVVAGGEIAPNEARDWHNWHKTATEGTEEVGSA